MGLCYVQNILIAAVNEKVELYILKSYNNDTVVELKFLDIYSNDGKVLTTCMDNYSKTIVIGDIMTFLTAYTLTGSSLESIALHHYSLSISSIKVLDEENFIAATDKEILVYQIDKAHTNIEPKDKYKIGKRINKFLYTSLKPLKTILKCEEDKEESEVDDVRTVVYVTTQGSIGVIAIVPESLFKYISAINDAIIRYEGNTYEFSHGKCFVNGNLAESLLRMDKVKAERIYNEIYYAAKPSFKKTLNLLAKLSLTH